MVSIKACIIPAAGRGGGMYPLTKDTPKEMLQLGGIPAIEHVVKEAIDSGCRQIIIVINRNKEIIRKHFTKKSSKYSKAVDFRFIFQDEPRGIAQAIYLAKPLIGNHYFALLFPDLVAKYQVPPLAQLIDVYKSLKKKPHMIAFARYPQNNTLFYGEFKLAKNRGPLSKIVHLCPRAKYPGDSHHKNNNLRGTGRNIYGPHIWPIVKKALEKLDEEEVGDPEIINLALASGQSIMAYEISGKIYDIGNFTGYEKAINEFR